MDAARRMQVHILVNEYQADGDLIRVGIYAVLPTISHFDLYIDLILKCLFESKTSCCNYFFDYNYEQNKFLIKNSFSVELVYGIPNGSSEYSFFHTL